MLSVDSSGNGLPGGAGARQRWTLRAMGKGFWAWPGGRRALGGPATPALQIVKSTRPVLWQAEKEKRGLCQQEAGLRPWRVRGIKPSVRTDWKPLSGKRQTTSFLPHGLAPPPWPPALPSQEKHRDRAWRLGGQGRRGSSPGLDGGSLQHPPASLGTQLHVQTLRSRVPPLA